MSNRKLMGAVSILFLAILFMSIGCGDGKRNTHQNTRKVYEGGKVTPPGGQKPGTPGNQKSQAEQRLRDARIAAEAGTPLMRENIPAGTYTLDEVMGFVEYQLGNEVLVSFANATVLENNDMTVKLNDKSGVAMTKDMDNGRTVESAKSFAATGASSLTSTGQN